MKLNGIKAILFDFDGTLVDSSASIIQAFNATLEAHGINPSSDEEVKAMIGRPLIEMFQTVNPDFGQKDLESCFTTYREKFWPQAVSLSNPMPTVPESIDQLSKQFKLGVVTTRISSGAIRILEHMKMKELFASIIGLEHVVHPKPHPEPVQVAMEELKVEPGQTVMIGDTPDDIEAGKAAGVATVGVTTGVHNSESLSEYGADIVVTSIGEFLPSVI